MACGILDGERVARLIWIKRSAAARAGKRWKVGHLHKLKLNRTGRSFSLGFVLRVIRVERRGALIWINNATGVSASI